MVCPICSKQPGDNMNMSEAMPTSSSRKVWSSSLWPTLIASSGNGMASVGGASLRAVACRRRASQPKFRSMLTRYFTSWVRRQRSTGPCSLRSICRPMASPFGATLPTTCMTNGGGPRPACCSWAVNRASQANCFLSRPRVGNVLREHISSGTPLYLFRDSVSMTAKLSEIANGAATKQTDHVLFARPPRRFSLLRLLRLHSNAFEPVKLRNLKSAVGADEIETCAGSLRVGRPLPWRHCSSRAC